MLDAAAAADQVVVEPVIAAIIDDDPDRDSEAKKAEREPEEPNLLRCGTCVAEREKPVAAGGGGASGGAVGSLGWISGCPTAAVMSPGASPSSASAGVGSGSLP
jgi:hypothetical protein